MRSEISPERLSELIGLIFDCVIAPQRWTATIEAIRFEFGFANAVFSVTSFVDGAPAIHFASGVDEDAAKLMIREETSKNLIELWGGRERIPHYPLGEPIVLSQAVDPVTWEINPYYLEFAKPRGLTDCVMIVVVRGVTTGATLAFGRHESAGPIGEPELTGLRLLAPHIYRAVTISELFELKAVEVATFSSTIDAFSAGVVLVGEDLAIVHANSAASAMLRAEDPILSRQGKLGLRSHVTNGALETALLQAVRDEAQLGHKGIAVPAQCVGGALCVLHVLPLRRGEIRPGLMQSAAAAVFVTPATSPPRLPSGALTLLYDLTPAEVRVFELICEGRTQAEIAGLLGVAPSTVKTHLLSVFAKTGCGRQAELVKLAASFTLPF